MSSGPDEVEESRSSNQEKVFVERDKERGEGVHKFHLVEHVAHKKRTCRIVQYRAAVFVEG